jgi:hypothetical protein
MKAVLSAPTALATSQRLDRIKRQATYEFDLRPVNIIMSNRIAYYRKS